MTPRQGSPGMNRQVDIYMAGTRGVRPARPIGYEALRDAAREVLSPEAYGYVAGGAGSEDTMRANREAFRRWRLVPRHLRGVETRDLSVELLGERLAAPVLLAPVGVLGILHPEAEVAAARAAAALEIPTILSTVSSKSIEEVAAASGGGRRWFQLYWPSDPELAASLVGRAERAGYEAIVVTIDTFLLAWRPRDIGHAYLPFLHGKGLANYLSDPVFRASLPVPPEDDPEPAIRRWAEVSSRPELTWDGLAELRGMTDLPILLKGIVHPDDARRAVDAGAAGMIVSNHGGRQVDGALASLDALPAVVEAVGDAATVLFDSGIRTGSDVVKALALGARAVLVGRPYAYALAVGGEAGVRETLLDLIAETDLTLGLAGYRSVAELGPEALVHDPSNR